MHDKYKLDQSKVDKEKEIINLIFSYIDLNKSFVFRAGAGVGKTFALVETIKYILEKYRTRFEHTSEKIRVITFTNAATNEIITRIGENNNLRCSTIHEFAWEIISNYPKELLKIHLEEIVEEIENKKAKINKSSLFLDYLNAHTEQQLFEYTILPNYYNLKNASDIRGFFDLPAKGGNASDFYDAFKAYFAEKKLQDSKTRIENYLNTNPSRIKNDYLIKYDINSNVKNLNKMRIDHDLCLKYFNKMFNKYSLLKKIISSKYPFLLIDEYQDTDDMVVSCVSKLIESEEINILVGFYGDEVQNIYRHHSDIVNNLCSKNLIEDIYKPYNRRCSTQVINVGNRINNMYQQESIFLDHDDGVVKVIDPNGRTLDEILCDLKSYGVIDCLILKNETIAEKIGIRDIYDLYSSTKEYSGANYSNLNAELLNHDITKLGVTQSLIFSLIKLYKNFLDAHCYLNDIFDSKYKITMKECKEFIDKIRSINIEETTTFGEFLNLIFDILDDDLPIAKSVKKKVLGNAECSLEYCKTIFSEKLVSEQNLSIYDIKINTFFKWYDFITEKEMEFVNYHTYHITKGLEYDNVAIVLEDRFRRNDDMKNFIINCINAIKTKNYDEINTNQVDFRNLLYVAITRSKKNLFIINLSTIPTSELEIIFS